jgi:cell division protein FtsL
MQDIMNDKQITIHPAILYVIMAIISGVFVAWGIISVSNARIIRNEKDIIENEIELKKLDEEKADIADVERIYDILDEIKADIKDIKNGTSNK